MPNAQVVQAPEENCYLWGSWPGTERPQLTKKVLAGSRTRLARQGTAICLGLDKSLQAELGLADVCRVSFPVAQVGSRAVSVEIEALLEWAKEQRIRIPKPGEIRNYLSRYSDMVEVARIGCRAATEAFGPETELSLEVYHDPEFEDEYLVLFIRQREYPDDLLEVIDSVQEQYEAELQRRTGWFLVTTDFQSPGDRA